MTWVDLVVLGVLALSALLAFSRLRAGGAGHRRLGRRGVRRHLGLAATSGRVSGVARRRPDGRSGRLRRGVPRRALILLCIIARWIGALVRRSVLGGFDRTLGLVFGLARGAALVIVAYIVAWDGDCRRTAGREPVLQARTLPIAYRGRALGCARSFRREYPAAALRAAAGRRDDRGGSVAGDSAGPGDRAGRCAELGDIAHGLDRRSRALPVTTTSSTRNAASSGLERPRRRRGDRARPARAAAPRPGSDRHRHASTATHFHSHRGLGLVGDNFGDAKVIASLPGPHRDRPQPLRHHRRHDPAQRPAAVCRFRVRRLRGGA